MLKQEALDWVSAPIQRERTQEDFHFNLSFGSWSKNENGGEKDEFSEIQGFLSKRLWASTTTESESNGENVKFRKELGTTEDDLQLA